MKINFIYIFTKHNLLFIEHTKNINKLRGEIALKKKFFKLIVYCTILISLINIIQIKPMASDNKKIIYITFDDGPGGKITSETLDILKEENVPATFFLIGGQIKNQEALVNRIKEEGHSLGLHSMSHNQNKLYCSNISFLNEMLEAQKVIENVTGERTNILRFPFGCNNQRYHLKNDLVDLLHENNLKIYDWNVDSTDGANPTAPPETFIKHAKSDKDTITLLMHCGFQNKNSPKALPQIIKYYKEQGYEFRRITTDTDEVFHFIKKR